MGAQRWTEEEKKALLKLAKNWGRIVGRRAYGDEGPDLDVRFDEMEELAVMVAQSLLSGTMEHLLKQQAGKLASPQACPECGTPCEVEEEPRPLVAHGGSQVEYAEPRCKCRKCRRSFFPSASSAGPGSAQL